MENRQIEIENRMKNIIWTVCGDYTLDAKPDVEGFLRCKYIALYDGIKQGAFAKYFDKDAMSLYLVKKVFLQADEGALLEIARMCMEEAVGNKIAKERSGVESIRKKAYEYVLEHDLDHLVKSDLGRLKVALMRAVLHEGTKQERRLQERLDRLYELHEVQDTMDIIRTVDACYNAWVDPEFETKKGSLEQVLAITLDELMEFNWQDFLTEEMYEENFAAYLERMSQEMTATGQKREEQDEQKEKNKKNIIRVSEEEFNKVHTYVELNFGKSYLSPLEENKLKLALCKGAHADCGLFFTEGILAHPVQNNYQLAYAKKQRDKNRYAYFDNHRIVKRNIEVLLGIMKRSLMVRQEEIEVLSDRGTLKAERLWRVGRSHNASLFAQTQKTDNRDFVVDLLIDASGSQRVRQNQVVLQAYIIMEALTQMGIPLRVMSYCTFWNHTILHRFREYDDGIAANDKIFEFVTSSNNRDGLAIRAAAHGLLERPEEQKIMIILSDGRPYDVVVNRPNVRNPKPYMGDYGARDTGLEVRRLRNLGVSVLGVFVGEEQDLEAEKKIFGKDFAYTRDITNFSKIVGNYMAKQLEESI
ncbi:MAG: nitric oxide reductase activation protein [Ruminococcus sp.]|nr:nitric oxide reductase activation protein [Ruminococcus sp.]